MHRVAVILAATLLATIFGSTRVRAAGNLTDGPNADLVYDPATGRIWFDASDTESTKLISYVLGSRSAFINLEDYRPAFVCVGADGCSPDDFQFGDTDPLNQGTGPIWYLGQLFPAGLTHVETTEFLTLAEYASALLVGGTFDIVPYTQEWDGVPGDGPAADLIYNHLSGNVRIDASDTVSQSFRHFGIGTLEANLRIENRQLPRAIHTFVDSELIQVAVPPTNSQFDLGNIFPPGMSDAEQLEAYLSDAWYGSSLEPEMGSGEFDLIVVPEPKSGWLPLGILLAMHRWTRRTSSLNSVGKT